MRILLFPLGAGLCFGLFEHFYHYGGEGPEVVALRVATHIGFVTIAFVTCHVAWLKGAGLGGGLWLGLALGAFNHSFWNYMFLIRNGSLTGGL